MLQNSSHKISGHWTLSYNQSKLDAHIRSVQICQQIFTLSMYINQSSVTKQLCLATRALILGMPLLLPQAQRLSCHLLNVIFSPRLNSTRDSCSSGCNIIKRHSFLIQVVSEGCKGTVNLLIVINVKIYFYRFYFTSDNNIMLAGIILINAHYQCSSNQSCTHTPNSLHEIIRSLLGAVIFPLHLFPCHDIFNQ